MQNALNRKFNLNSYFNGKSANTIKSLLCFAPLSDPNTTDVSSLLKEQGGEKKTTTIIVFSMP